MGKKELLVGKLLGVFVNTIGSGVGDVVKVVVISKRNGGNHAYEPKAIKRFSDLEANGGFRDGLVRSGARRSR